MTPEVLTENARRAAALTGPYDPYSGVGSPVPRADGTFLGVPCRLPVALLADPVYHAVKDAPKGTPERALAVALRHRHDFEFWAAECAAIQTKTGATTNLVLNVPQRLLLRDVEAMRAAGVPMRLAVLKHRQFGSTTFWVAYAAWLQRLVLPGTNAYVISLETGAAAVLLSRYERVADHHQAGPFTLDAVRNAPNARRIRETGGLVSIGSVNNPQGASGTTNQIVVVSEAGKMPSNDVQSAERLITNVTSTVPATPGTLVALESTAEPMGALFRETVLEAEAGRSAYALTFVSWLTDPGCQMPVADPAALWARVEEPGELGDHLRLLWAKGATLEQLQFFVFQRGQKPSLAATKQEFPSTPLEAFQFGERRVFDAEHVHVMRREVREPVARGELVADAVAGPGAFRNVRFEPRADGRLLVWRFPGDLYGGALRLPSGARVAHRYCAGGDVAVGRGETADWSVTRVLDRAPRLWGGPPEFVCAWRGREDPDLYAWRSAQIACWYEKALWALEVNSLDQRDPDEKQPDFGLTALDEIVPHYTGVYLRPGPPDKVTNDPTFLAGWRTTATTKPMLVSALTKGLRDHFRAETDDPAAGDDAFVEPWALALDEFDVFLQVGAKMQAAPKKKDDVVVADGITAHLDQTMPPPLVVEPPKAPRRSVAPSYARF